jgi:hypothetical protein
MSQVIRRSRHEVASPVARSNCTKDEDKQRWRRPHHCMTGAMATHTSSQGARSRYTDAATPVSRNGGTPHRRHHPPVGFARLGSGGGRRPDGEGATRIGGRALGEPRLSWVSHLSPLNSHALFLKLPNRNKKNRVTSFRIANHAHNKAKSRGKIFPKCSTPAKVHDLASNLITLQIIAAMVLLFL